MDDRGAVDGSDVLHRTRHDGTPRTTPGHVEFTIRGRRVVVHSDGEILIYREESLDDPSF